MLEAACEVGDNALRAACVVRVTPAQGVTVRYAVDGGAERTAASDPATEHDLELDVLRPETAYGFVVRADDGTERSGSFRSGTPPAEVASRLEVTGTPSFPYLGTSAPCSEAAWAVV
ncbi:MAG: hypothetical protein R3F59_39275, partial [Myxococcota bacterium]